MPLEPPPPRPPPPLPRPPRKKDFGHTPKTKITKDFRKPQSISDSHIGFYASHNNHHRRHHLLPLLFLFIRGTRS
ncbi:hypothetical protein K2173_018254 [Erythroxylum novogranatense]|uniref:Uncharacterized protein n=1 Tax=Erythroxylum novogranatense TaxID=1862640 RepID=A0AAV8U9W5_9ROSI|nr:hypothetical protein K2173_018254 [Erythroxylum novogranatense]